MPPQPLRRLALVSCAALAFSAAHNADAQAAYPQPYAYPSDQLPELTQPRVTVGVPHAPQNSYASSYAAQQETMAYVESPPPAAPPLAPSPPQAQIQETPANPAAPPSSQPVVISSSAPIQAAPNPPPAPGNQTPVPLPQDVAYSYPPSQPVVYREPSANSPGSSPPMSPYMSFATRHGFDFGVQGIDYRYREPSLDVTELGPMIGFTASGTLTFGQGYFAMFDARYALGNLDYRGSGTESDKWNDLWEVRGLIGTDFIMPHYSLSPYGGLGFRELYDNNDGLSTIGDFGYRRTNQIYYLPIGVMPRTRIDADSRLTGLFEYDILLHGSQTSYLSDGGAGDPNIENQQHSGFGIKANIMYERPWWSIGPFLNYWSIDQSKPKWVTDNNPGTCAFYSTTPPCAAGFYEPANHTYEMGIQFKVHFF